jgi:hypothetical protein
MKQSYRPVLEFLETRLVPALSTALPVPFGFPWPSNQLTLSFVPDGTSVGSQSSQLFAALNREMPTVMWQGEILRAFQTWAANANIGISVVADDGEPLGAPGPLQGDANFGDIRIAAVPGASSLATGIPFSPGAGTWSGDVILNSTTPFGVGNLVSAYDLFSVALHEAGHALGIDDNLNPNSAMFSYYSYRTGLSSGDIQSVQSLYGARPIDGLGNATLGTAIPFQDAALVQYIGQFTNPGSGFLPPLAVDAGLSMANAAEFYSYQSVPNDPGFTVQLHTAGISMLDAKLTVYDWKGRMVDSATASDPQHGDLSLRVDGVHGKQLYYIEVQGATGDVFRIGNFQLQIVPDSPRPLLPFKLADLIAHFLPPPDNHSLGTATALHATVTATNAEFTTNGQIGSSGQTDYYSLTAPLPPSGQMENMTVMVWNRDGSTLNPTVSVYDSGGNPVTTDLIESAEGTYIVRVESAEPGATYYVSVQAPAGTTGKYFLGVDVNSQPDSTQVFATGQLGVPASSNAPAAPFAQLLAAAGTTATTTTSTTTTTPTTPVTPPPAIVQQDFRSLVLQQNMLFHFDFSVQSPGATVQTAVEVTLFDMNGKILGDWIVSNGQTISTNLYLPAGSYTFRLVGGAIDVNGNQAQLPPTTYTISGYPVNDPIGPALVPPTTPPPPPPIPYQWLQTALYRVLALLDPYGHPLN